MNKKRIFTFWEPKENLPAYLKLCMQTWKKFLPEYEIVILDYSSLDQWLGKNFFDEILYKKFSLAKQADAIRCAILKKYGGIWMDCDTIITSNGIRNFLNLKSSFVLIGHHVAFICADPNSIVLKKWLDGILIRLKFYKKYYPHSALFKILAKLRAPKKYKKMKKHFKNWDFLGNGILSNILIKNQSNPMEFMSIDRQKSHTLPEQEEYGSCSKEIYQTFYFENDYSKTVLKNTQGLILLHNSWTPEKYKKMSEEEFLAQNNTLSNILKKLNF